MDGLPANPSTSLPRPWIDRLFQRLHTVYGNKFSEMWKGQEVEDVKEAWSAELAHLTGAELKTGLDRLRKNHPSWPPTLFEFSELCRSNAAQEAHKALPWPAPDMAAIDPRINALKTTLTGNRNARAWVGKILERHAAGDKTLSYLALKAAQNAENVR